MNNVKEKAPSTAATVQSAETKIQNQNSIPFPDCKALYEKLRRLGIILSVASELLQKKEYDLDPFEPHFQSLIDGAIYENNKVMDALTSFIGQEVTQP